MAGISIWQVIVIVFPLASIVGMFWAITREPKSGLSRPLHYLDGSFVVSVISIILLLLVSREGLAEQEAGLGAILLVYAVVWLAGVAFWISLGTLARRLGRSVIIWVGLTFITSPIGPIVSYFFMRSLATSAIHQRAILQNEVCQEAKQIQETTECGSEFEDEAPLVHKIQAACQIATMHAGYPNDEYERQRFEEYISKAIELAKDIRDDFYHSAAIHLIVSALIEDNQLDRALELIHDIRDDMILEKAKKELIAAKR